MLSRTADHLFWMSRYQERAESTARMLDAHAPDAPRVDGSSNSLITVFRGEDRDIYSCTPLCKRGSGGG